MFREKTRTHSQRDGKERQQVPRECIQPGVVIEQGVAKAREVLRPFVAVIDTRVGVRRAFRRFAARIANITVSAGAVQTPNLVNTLIAAINKLPWLSAAGASPPPGGTRPGQINTAFYCNRAVRTALDTQAMAKGNNFLIAKDGEKNLVVRDFELRFSYRFTSDWGNSGVQYRSKDFGNHVVGGYQADFEVGTTYSGILYEEKMTRGIMAARGEKVVWGEDGKKQVVGKTEKSSKEIQETIKKGEWIDYVVIAKGDHLQHFINGNMTVDVVDKDPKKQVKEGILALQLHAGPPMKVQFKNIRIKQL